MCKKRRSRKFLRVVKFCEKEALFLNEIKKDFIYAYKDDVKNYTIKLLDDRIAALEKTIAEMDK